MEVKGECGNPTGQSRAKSKRRRRSHKSASNKAKFPQEFLPHPPTDNHRSVKDENNNENIDTKLNPVSVSLSKVDNMKNRTILQPTAHSQSNNINANVKYSNYSVINFGADEKTVQVKRDSPLNPSSQDSVQKKSGIENPPSQEEKPNKSTSKNPCESCIETQNLVTSSNVQQNKAELTKEDSRAKYQRHKQLVSRMKTIRQVIQDTTEKTAGACEEIKAMKQTNQFAIKNDDVRTVIINKMRINILKNTIREAESNQQKFYEVYKKLREEVISNQWHQSGSRVAVIGSARDVGRV